MPRTHRTSPQQVVLNARELRNNMTPAEELLWTRLRRRALGVSFRRQHPIGPYIADFYCHEMKLVVEVDGRYHLRRDVRERDRLREMAIRDHGLGIVRVRNDELFSNLDAVVERIRQWLELAANNPPSGSLREPPSPGRGRFRIRKALPPRGGKG